MQWWKFANSVFLSVDHIWKFQERNSYRLENHNINYLLLQMILEIYYLDNWYYTKGLCIYYQSVFIFDLYLLVLISGRWGVGWWKSETAAGEQCPDSSCLTAEYTSVKNTNQTLLLLHAAKNRIYKIFTDISISTFLDLQRPSKKTTQWNA